MGNTFLTAQWLKLAMANYAVDPRVLAPLVPKGTELDDWNGTHYISLVGFMFMDTHVKGIAVPFHKDFEEVNLRFYVRYNDAGVWKRGVVFVKEIVPKPLLTFVANTLYKEHYQTMDMEHTWDVYDASVDVQYRWKSDGGWNHIRVQAERVVQPIPAGSEAEFITEHYWGYTQLPGGNTAEYEVRHPRWNVHPVTHYDIHCNVAEVYGEQFADAFTHAPRSVFLADGSAISVHDGRTLSI